MFTGDTELNLDDKGRMTIPARYRQGLIDRCGGRMVITRNPIPKERCLLLYPFPEWEVIAQQITSLSSFNPVSRLTQRLLLGHATEAELDSHSRFRIPEPLRKYAYMDKKLMLIGQGRKFEVWSEQHWSSSSAEWLSPESTMMQELPAELAKLSL